MDRAELYKRFQRFGMAPWVSKEGSSEWGIERFASKFIGWTDWFGADSRDKFRDKAKTLSLMLKTGIVNSEKDFEEFMEFVTRTTLTYESSEGVPNTEYQARVRISNATRNGVDGYLLSRTIFEKPYS